MFYEDKEDVPPRVGLEDRKDNAESPSGPIPEGDPVVITKITLIYSWPSRRVP